MKRAAKATKDAVSTIIKNEPLAPSPIKFRTDKPGFFQLALHVKPGARVSRVAEITPDFVGVQVRGFLVGIFIISRLLLLPVTVKLMTK